MKRTIYVLGTAGHAHDVADVADALGYRAVFVARCREEAASCGPADAVELECEALLTGTDEFALGIGDNAARAAVSRRLPPSIRMPALIHPDTTFGRGQRETVESARGTVVFAGVRMTGNIEIGRFCTINLNATVSHDCVLGDFVNLSPGATVAGNVYIEDGAWIGAGAVINQGKSGHKRRIGAFATIGSGAVVLTDCDAHSTYVGVPARKVR